MFLTKQMLLPEACGLLAHGSLTSNLRPGHFGSIQGTQTRRGIILANLLRIPQAFSIYSL